MKKITLLFILCSFNLPAFAGSNACIHSGKVDDPIPTSELSCYTTPQNYDVKIYEVGLCDNLSSLGKLSGTVNPNDTIASNCTKIFYSSNAVDKEITSSLGTSKLTGGKFSSIQKDRTYSYSYVKISNTVSTKMITYISLPNAGGTIIGRADSASYTPLSQIAACWTINYTYLRSVGNPISTKCGVSPDVSYGTIVETFDYFGDSVDSGGNVITPYFTNASIGLQNNNGTAYLTIGGHYYQTTQTSVPDQAIFFYPLASPIVIHEDNYKPTVKVLFEVTSANKVKNDSSPDNPIMAFKINSLNINITAH